MIMAKSKYYLDEGNSGKSAKAIATNRPVSLKYSTELCRELKGKSIDSAQNFLGRIMKKSDHLPLRKYNAKMGHRRGESKSFTKSGRYPLRTAKVFSDLLNSVKANADYKGLNADNLIIKGMFASQGFSRASMQPQGRIAGKRREKKSTHLEIVVVEGAE